tara:strand:- start:38414 stop:38590 length:177 start_codon:yes stop_codon:yes gene_type:complete
LDGVSVGEREKNIEAMVHGVGGKSVSSLAGLLFIWEIYLVHGVSIEVYISFVQGGSLK